MSIDKKILIGIITSAHGINGEVKIKSFTSSNDSFINLSDKLFTDNDSKINITIRSTSKNPSKILIAKIDGIISRNDAEKLKDTKLYVKRSDLPEIIDQDEYYIEDLISLQVIEYQATDNHIGKITEVANYGAGDIIEITFNDGKKELFPFINEIFPDVDLDNKIIYFKFPDYLK